MVKWYHKSLPSLRCGFDSRYPLQNHLRRFSLLEHGRRAKSLRFFCLCSYGVSDQGAVGCDVAIGCREFINGDDILQIVFLSVSAKRELVSTKELPLSMVIV